LVVLSQDTEHCRALQYTVINTLIPLNAGELLTSCKNVGFSIMNLFHPFIISFNIVNLLEEIMKLIFND